MQERIDLKENVRNENLPLMDEKTYSEATIGVSQNQDDEEHKVLGVVWKPEANQLIFDVANLAQLALDLHPTKRNLREPHRQVLRSTWTSVSGYYQVQGAPSEALPMQV